MDELDLDAFIANIEESAPQEEFDPTLLKCKECDTPLENLDDEYVCPNCSAQPTNLLPIEATELQYTAAGHAIAGQRVKLESRRKFGDIDYGWAWSTDEAIAHILKLQIDGLERIGLVDERFRLGCTNMWIKFWMENIAIYIKDAYRENDLLPLKLLKHRDIEVLVKVQDKLLVPTKNPPTKEHNHNMMGTKFYRTDPKATDLTTNARGQESPISSPSPRNVSPDAMDIEEDEDSKDLEGSVDEDTLCKTSFSSYVNKDNISILTLDRTLAFLEAAARLLDVDLFASDIIRACTQRLIPFFGAHKTLPDKFKLNVKDRCLFSKIRPPSPTQLVKAASLLVHRIYHEKLPVIIPSPSLERLLVRMLDDMNLPYDLLREIRGHELNFSSFLQTRHTIIRSSHKQGNFPLYDRWAFSILLSHLKRLFVLDNASIKRQKWAANEQILNGNQNIFIFQDWAKQIGMKLQLIMSYDPYILFHPMANLQDIQPTSQVYNYVSTFMNDKVRANIRKKPVERIYDETIRSELSDFLHHQMPKPADIDYEAHDETELERATNVRYPITDAFTRTKRFWLPDISGDSARENLLFKDFRDEKLLTIRRKKLWTIYDNQDHTKRRLNLLSSWPDYFKLLLSIGGYLCLCRPHELLNEFKLVEKFLYPELNPAKRLAKSRA